MELVKKNLGIWIKAAIILTVGILFIVMGAAKGEASGNASDAINIILGIVLIAIGSLSLALGIVAALVAKQSFIAVGIPGGIALALGISLLVAKYATGLIVLVLYIVPYLLIAIGAVILVDAIFRLIFAIKAKTVKDTLFAIVVAMVVGVAILTLGALCIGGNVIPTGAQLVILGVVLILVALLQVLFTFVKGPEILVAVVGAEPKSKKE